MSRLGLAPLPLGPPSVRRFVRMAVVLFVFLALAAGCARGRHPSSPLVPPPADPMGETRKQELERLLADPDLMLSPPRDYTLGPGDVLSVTLLGRPDILGRTGASERDFREGVTLTVTENPMIVFPLIGAIRVHGKTADQLQQELTGAYARFVKSPWIVLTIEKYYRHQVTVLGVVNEPGKHPWEFGDTVLDALFKAGGLAFTARGGLPPGRSLRVYREKIDARERVELSLEELVERLSEGKRIVPRTEIVIPIEEFILGGDLLYNIPVQPGDILYVPTAGAVMVTGRVRHPGVIYLGPSLHTVAQVLTERGGLRYGATSAIEIIRSRGGDDPVSYFLHARRMLARQDQDFLLQDGDQIFVYPHPVRAPLEWIGSLFRATVATGVSATYSPAP